VIPAVGAHEVLVNGPLRDWWMKVVSQVQHGGGGGSTQGYYMFASDGTPVFWDNYYPRIKMAIERGYEMAKRNPKPGAPVPHQQDEVSVAAPLEPPPDTSIVRLFTRISPVPAGADPINTMLGRDFMWIPRAELESIAANAREVGKTFELPESMQARLCLFHLVDNVRGLVWAYRPDAVSRCTITAKVVGIEKDVKKLTLAGEFAKQDSHPPQWTSRGLEGTLEGELDIDSAGSKIVRLRALAKSTAWDDQTFNRNTPAPSGKYPLVTAIVEANDPIARKVAPEVARQGASYLQPRIQRSGAR
jgi:hypothetical protein